MICLSGTVFAYLRWLRVAQREHYIPGQVSKFAWRWWNSTGVNRVLALCAIAVIVLPFPSIMGALLIAVVAILGPVGLSVRGRTSQLVATRRLNLVALVTICLQFFTYFFTAFFVGPIQAAFLGVLLVAPLIDLSLLILKPVEEQMANKFVEKAKTRLQSVRPKVVAITGSYGKTSTKTYAAHLIAGTKSVVPTPASFNNRAGISKAVNEHLTPGTEVFITEMGTFGPGEIKELCDITPPDISVITAIGPVHLERFGTEDAILEAKSEILERASICVFNIDDPRLAALADKTEAQGKKVWRCGSIEAAELRVVIEDGTTKVFKDGSLLFETSEINAPATNIACAMAVALELGVGENDIKSRLASLPTPPHRQEVNVTPDGLTIIDDTFNANPASVRRGLELLGKYGKNGCRRVVATPGMVELGDRQRKENSMFAKDAGQVATDLVIIGLTNRSALMSGVTPGLNVVTVDRLPQAVRWMREHVGEGDVVLYANDLPDHFP